ncbi:mannose-6-phosphate isomerase-like protein (cupin superfamily) [Arthrobacter sp. CAN_A6]|uniref:cupin domain-containing protein n=1 Tax=Arthrobacter sp. CAN_A6 TaxID=2787721 RepID=UPI0018CB97D4
MDSFIRTEKEVEEAHWHDQRGSISFRTLLGDTPDTSSFVTGIARLPVGGHLAPHRHAPPETYSVLEGQGVVVLNGIDHDVAAKSSVHIPENAVHGIRNAGSGILRFFYVLAADSFDEIDYQFVETDAG